MSSNDSDDPPPTGPLEPNWVDPAEVEWPDPVPAVRPLVTCWRCGLTDSPAAGRCPRCAARVTDDEPDDPSFQCGLEPRRSNPLAFVLLIYALFLLTSVVWGWVILADRDRMTQDELLSGTAVVEVIDTILVLTALAVVGRLALPAQPHGARVIAWLSAGPALFLLICANVIFFIVLRDFIKPPAFLRPEVPKLTAFTVLLMCVQPAIIEEVFFRYLALGALARATGMPTAIWVSSVMFAMAHIYNPLGLPYLFVAGVLLGYARVYGGLILPMILHFIHNFVVIAIEVMQ